MKKSVFILLTFTVSQSSLAVHLSKDRTGQVLIFPYYTVMDGYDSLLNITNTSNEAKALRVRFRESSNNREVFAMNLYLGAKDVWTGAVFKNHDNDVQLISFDQSCSIPSFDGEFIVFENSKYTGDLADRFGIDDLRMNSGFVEVIEMGVLSGDSAIAATMGQAFPTQDCQKLTDAWDKNSSNHYWIDNPSTDLTAPSGGIAGNIVLIDVAQGIAVSEQATVLEDFSDEVLHFDINNDSPSLADGKHNSIIQDGEGNYHNFDWNTGFEAVSSVLMKASVSHEYTIETNISAQSNHVFTMPTWQYHTDPVYSNQQEPIKPFKWNNFNNSGNCVWTHVDITNREGFIYSVINVTNPGIPDFPNQSFCQSVTNLNINTSQNIIDSNFENGYIEYSTILNMNNNDSIIYGLPVVSFSTHKYVNGNIGGNLANYAGIFNSKDKKIIVSNIQSNDANMEIANNGIGQVLLYPYYTVTNELVTLMTIVNTSDKVKAVSVRFREGKNARQVMGVNVYLAPYDVWTAALVETDSTVLGHIGEASALLLSDDSTCTTPMSGKVLSLEFVPFSFTTQGANDFYTEDGLGTNMLRAQEGFIEVIEMGELIGDDKENAIKRRCNALAEHWVSGQWTDDPTTNIIAPSGKGDLYGSLSIIDVANGLDFTYDATAITRFTNKIIHHNSGNFNFGLASGNNTKTTLVTDTGTVKTTWNTTIDAVSALLMKSGISSDYEISSSIGAQSEWINTYPTKHYYVDPMFSHLTNGSTLFFSSNSDDKGACEGFEYLAYNREQQVDYIQQPAKKTTSDLAEHCWTVNLAEVNKGENNNTIFSSYLLMKDWNVMNNLNNYNSIYRLSSPNGWMQSNYTKTKKNTSQLVGIGNDGKIHIIYGKPVLGFIAQKYVNGVLSGNTLANYAIVNHNKSGTRIIIEDQK